MKRWPTSPAQAIAAAFAALAASRMSDLPISNPMLQTETLGFDQPYEGDWTGVLITPLAISLLRLPGVSSNWQTLPEGATCRHRYPSGTYDFLVAHTAQIGIYHLCPLLSPVQDIPDQTQARLTGQAIITTLMSAPEKNIVPARRRFLRLPTRPPA